jgi:signal transduction histidine kinase
VADGMRTLLSPTMTINLVADDEELYRLCRDILAENAEWRRSCTLVALSPSAPWCDADLHIWDFHPSLPLPERLRCNPVRHLFLVDRKDLDAFQESTRPGGVNVLLKPVGRATLQTFLAPVISSGTANSLRADRDEMLQCLIQTNLKLQQYDQDRTTFLARAVHDFRAPLTALEGYCGLLLSGPLGPLNDNQRDVLQRMEQSAKRVARMAGVMLQLSVGKHVKRLPDRKPGNLRDCVEQAIHEIAQFANEKSISLTLDLAPCVGGRLYFEAGQIEQVLLNVLDNACKFTPRGGSIDIRGYPFFWERRHIRAALSSGFERRARNSYEPNSYRIDVSDAGSPIPTEHLDRIFEEYTSYSGGCDRSGGGLGLAICRMIVSQHDGRIWAENTDSGPLFSFVVPMQPPDSGHANAVLVATQESRVGGRTHADE